jgi:hypothetical protein
MRDKAFELFDEAGMGGARPSLAIGHRVDFVNLPRGRRCGEEVHKDNQCCIFFNEDGRCVFHCKAPSCINKDRVLGRWKEGSEKRDLEGRERLQFVPNLLYTEAEKALGSGWELQVSMGIAHR